MPTPPNAYFPTPAYNTNYLLYIDGEIANEYTFNRPLKQIADSIEYLKTQVSALNVPLSGIYEPVIPLKRTAFNTDFATALDITNGTLAGRSTSADDPRLSDARVPLLHRQSVDTLDFPSYYKNNYLFVDSTGTLVAKGTPAEFVYTTLTLNIAVNEIRDIVIPDVPANRFYGVSVESIGNAELLLVKLFGDAASTEIQYSASFSASFPGDFAQAWRYRDRTGTNVIRLRIENKGTTMFVGKIKIVAEPF